MKKCVKCNTNYDNKENYCKKCGDKLINITTEEEKKKAKSNRDIIRYFFGIIIIIGSVQNIIKFYGIIGVLFGISLLPITYKIIKKIPKINDNKNLSKNWNYLQVIVPILLAFTWGISLPEEPLEYINIYDFEQIIGINEEYKIEFDTNLDILNDVDVEKFEFVSSDEDIAIVENGVIKGISAGTVTITIKGENGIETSEDYIIKYIDIESIELIGDTNVLVGNSENIVADLTPSNANDKIVRWESSNPDIVSVNSSGQITAISSGVATITAISEKGKTKSIEINSVIPVNSLTINEKNISVEKGKNKTISITTEPKEINSKDLKWSSSDNNIVKVENGVIYAQSEGNAQITVESLNGIKASVDIEVYEIKPEKLKLNKSIESISVGKSLNVNATITPSNASDKSISWSSSNKSVATVENGKITAVGRGNATITAKTSNGISSSVVVVVTEPAPIKITRFSHSMDSVCGVQWQISIKNNSGKTINYITLTWYNFNSVGDFVYDSIDGKNYTKIRYTGPLNSGSNTGTRVNTTKFYNCSYKSSTLSEIVIEYADGTKKTIKNSEFTEYTGLTS